MDAYEEQVFAGRVFNVIVAAYKAGLLDKMTKIQNEVIDAAMKDTGISITDLVTMADGVDEDSVQKVERSLLQVKRFLPFMANERVFAVMALMLKNPVVADLFTQALIWVTKKGGVAIDDLKLEAKGFIETKAGILKRQLQQYIGFRRTDCVG